MNAQAAASPASAAPTQARGPIGASTTVAVQARAAQLEQVFAHIGATRMHGVPMLNTALRVQAVGFEVVVEGEAHVLQGILITPWFMNLLRLPLVPDATSATTSAPEPGSKRSHLCGEQLFEFISGQEEALGSFEACSLFSPMFEFANQAGAVSTATEILKLLRTPPEPRAPAGSVPAPDRQARSPTSSPRLTPVAAAAVTPASTPAVPSRRGFMLGRVRPGAAP
jgi:[NiFe] hydrogenase assembly HybE family chaperone